VNRGPTYVIPTNSPSLPVPVVFFPILCFRYSLKTKISKPSVHNTLNRLNNWMLLQLWPCYQRSEWTMNTCIGCNRLDTCNNVASNTSDKGEPCLCAHEIGLCVRLHLQHWRANVSDMRAYDAHCCTGSNQCYT
jgi:hypothetical protein